MLGAAAEIGIGQQFLARRFLAHFPSRLEPGGRLIAAPFNQTFHCCRRSFKKTSGSVSTCPPSHPWSRPFSLLISTNATARILGRQLLTIRIAAIQQTAGIILLQAPHRFVKESDDVPGFAVDLFDLGGKSVPLAERPRDKQVEIRIDSVAGQAGDEVIEAVERLGVERATPRFLAVANPVRKGGRVHVVEPHGIDAELGHPRGDLVCVFLVRKIAGKTQVHPQKPNAIFPDVKVTIRPRRDPVATTDRFRPRAEVGNARFGVIPGQHEWKQTRRIGVLCGKPRHSDKQQRPSPKPAKHKQPSSNRSERRDSLVATAKTSRIRHATNSVRLPFPLGPLPFKFFNMVVPRTPKSPAASPSRGTGRRRTIHRRGSDRRPLPA